MSKSKKLLLFIGAVAVFWICVLIGPFIAGLLNYISFLLTGGTQGLIYKLSLYFMQGIACGIACVLCHKMSDSRKLVLTNAIIYIVIACFIIYNNIFVWYNNSSTASLVISIAITLITALIVDEV